MSEWQNNAILNRCSKSAKQWTADNEDQRVLSWNVVYFNIYINQDVNNSSKYYKYITCTSIIQLLISEMKE